MATMSGASRISAERGRVIEKGQYGPQHDLEHHTDGELLDAADAYITASRGYKHAGIFWPWGQNSFKPEDNPIDNLVKAGQFIAAEIDRLQAVENT